MDPAALIIAALLGLALGALLLPLAARLADRPIPRGLALALPLAAALTAVGLWLRHGLTPSLAWSALYAGVFLVCAGVDLADCRIPNVVVLPALVVALLAAPWFGPGLLPALVGGLVGTLPWGLGALVGWNGMGDVKLALLVGLTAGFPAVLYGLLVGTAAGGLVALPLILTGRRKQMIPYGPFIALAGLVALVWPATSG